MLTLPAVHATTRDLVAAVARACGADVASRIRYTPDPLLEANFGSFPPLSAIEAEAAGFRSDGNLDRLVVNALAALNG